MTRPRLEYAPALDGVRACAVLVVMASHTGLPVPGGHVGVDVFFVLSGFLITSLLLQEYYADPRRGIALGAFFQRRVLRLYPALVALSLVLTAYALLAPSPVRADETLFGALPALFYFANWVRATDGLGHLGLYEHTWSLSVEEQFYLLWPLILLLTLLVSRRLTVLGLVVIAGILGSLAARLSMDSGSYVYIANGLDTQGDRLLTGCALAMLVWSRGGPSRAAAWMGSVLRWLQWPAVAFLGAAALLWPRHADGVAFRVLMTVTALAAAVLVAVAYLDRAGVLARVLALSPLRYVGRRSYGLYLWHYPIFVVMNDSFDGNLVLKLVVGFTLPFVVAELSYRWVERPFLRLKDRVGRRDEAPDPQSDADSGDRPALRRDTSGAAHG